MYEIMLRLNICLYIYSRLAWHKELSHSRAASGIDVRTADAIGAGAERDRGLESGGNLCLAIA